MATANENTNSEMLKHFTRELPVTLNDSELQTYGKMLAEKVREEELAEEKKKQVVSDHAGRIKLIRNDIKRIADARAKGEELRPVKCGERLRGNVIEIVRLDRGEVVDTRPADLRDLQTTIPGTGIPEDLDEGPRGDDLGAMGGPDKTGRGVDPTIDHGESMVSSSGDTVHVGAPDDTSDDVRICDACSEVVSDDDELIEYEGSTIHAACKPDEASEPDAALDHATDEGASPSDDEDEIDRRLREREESLAGGHSAARQTAKDVEQRDREIAADKGKPKRERSRKANEAKGKPKKKGK